MRMSNIVDMKRVNTSYFMKFTVEEHNSKHTLQIYTYRLESLIILIRSNFLVLSLYFDSFK